MSVNDKILLYSLATTFSTILKIDTCENTKKFIKKNLDQYLELDVSDKIYYSEYSLKLSKTLIDYLGDIILFELNPDNESEINHDFNLYVKKINLFIYLCHMNLFKLRILFLKN